MPLFARKINVNNIEARAQQSDELELRQSSYRSGVYRRLVGYDYIAPPEARSTIFSFGVRS